MRKKKGNIKRLIKDDHFRVAIFGSARIKKEDKNYKLIKNLAKMIAQENVDIVTGGGPGIMEAANEGHEIGGVKNKSHSVGLLIKLPKEQESNKHLDVKKEFKVFSSRLDYFMLLSNAVIVAPGGLGTALEFFYTWQLVQVEQVCDIPIILLGKQWSELIDWVKANLLKHKYIKKEDLDSIFIAKNSKEALNIVKRAKSLFDKGGKNICLNIKKYKV
jgi:uncharacterized protein (TIGR00730 family)